MSTQSSAQSKSIVNLCGNVIRRSHLPIHPRNLLRLQSLPRPDHPRTLGVLPSIFCMPQGRTCRHRHELQILDRRSRHQMSQMRFRP